MQIEETFRDLKSPAYGLGLRHSRTSSSERFDIMLLIALMLQLTCWLAGVHAQKQGWDKHFRANTVRNRNVLSTVRLGMEVLRHSGYTTTREDSLWLQPCLLKIYSHMVTFWGNYEGISQSKAGRGQAENFCLNICRFYIVHLAMILPKIGRLCD